MMDIIGKISAAFFFAAYFSLFQAAEYVYSDECRRRENDGAISYGSSWLIKSVLNEQDRHALISETRMNNDAELVRRGISENTTALPNDSLELKRKVSSQIPKTAAEPKGVTDTKENQNKVFTKNGQTYDLRRSEIIYDEDGFAGYVESYCNYDFCCDGSLREKELHKKTYDKYGRLKSSYIRWDTYQKSPMYNTKPGYYVFTTEYQYHENGFSTRSYDEEVRGCYDGSGKLAAERSETITDCQFDKSGNYLYKYSIRSHYGNNVCTQVDRNVTNYNNGRYSTENYRSVTRFGAQGSVFLINNYYSKSSGDWFSKCTPQKLSEKDISSFRKEVDLPAQIMKKNGSGKGEIGVFRYPDRLKTIDKTAFAQNREQGQKDQGKRNTAGPENNEVKDAGGAVGFMETLAVTAVNGNEQSRSDAALGSEREQAYLRQSVLCLLADDGAQGCVRKTLQILETCGNGPRDENTVLEGVVLLSAAAGAGSVEGKADLLELKESLSKLYERLLGAREEFLRGSRAYYAELFDRLVGSQGLWWENRSYSPEEYFNNDKSMIVDFAIARLKNMKHSPRARRLLADKEEIEKRYCAEAKKTFDGHARAALSEYKAKVADCAGRLAYSAYEEKENGFAAVFRFHKDPPCNT